jgi:predicted CXXCH cytochrome family protein
MRRITFLAVLVVLGGVSSARGADQFDHETHDGLFPVCDSCHAGIATGNTAEYYPEPSDCAACHNEDDVGVIDWTGPTERPSNVEFSHDDHASTFEDFDMEFDCRECHGDPSTDFDLVLQPVDVSDVCGTCHDDAIDHYDGSGDCSVCHVDLTAATGYTVADLQNWPAPTSHQEKTWIEAHGGMAEQSTVSCAVCHAQESCTQCHRNADQLAPIQSLGNDERVAMLVQGKPGYYPRPATHDADWLARHGAQARESIQSCSNCHVQAGCTTCHGEGEARRVVANLPHLRPGERPLIGSDVSRRFHPPNFIQEHGMEAGADPTTCQTCHGEATCEQCHDGIASSRFHGFNYVERHGTEAYQASLECSTCHSVEVFCRECHTELGIAGVSGSFHDRQPLWLLNHGQAARQELTSCVSCHAQTDCMKCHATDTLGVNPHGPDFDADALGDANGAGCRACHPGGITP